MIGLMFLVAMGLWITLAIYLGRAIPKWMGLNAKRIWTGAFTLLIIVLPVSDEIIGRYQFDRLCKMYATGKANLPAQSYIALRPVSNIWLHVTDSIKPIRIQILSYRHIDNLDIARTEVGIYQTDGWILRWLALAGESHCGGINIFELPLEEQNAIRNLKYPELAQKPIIMSELAVAFSNFKTSTKEQTK